MSDSPVPDDDEEEDDGLIAVLEGQSVFLHGASSLPKRGEPVEQRPCITPYGVRTWIEAGDEVPGKCQHVNDVIGILLKEHFPGMVTLPAEGNVPEVARTWDHYKPYAIVMPYSVVPTRGEVDSGEATGGCEEGGREDRGEATDG
ncbi:hypothetical protein ZWY2020_006548 [Hordeum vulgare]|nr:hypothetical protein ZWY2020_006548 [Hordeum vulgare]